MGIQETRRTDQKEKEIGAKDPVGKSGFYIGDGVAVQQPARYQQNDTPAVRIEPAEEGSEKDRQKGQKVDILIKENRQIIYVWPPKLGLFSVPPTTSL
jgi:hypothetical protein